MTVAITAWQQGNQGLYVKMSPGETDTFAIDVRNELDSTDELLSVTATVDAGITLLSSVVRVDYSVRSRPHQMMVILRAAQTGVYHIKCVAPTLDGLVIVKHFDVLVEEK
tara:strand:- start:615 stop:944 length:330 start_codon:yes stop_codon:yes gene_type:complete